MRRVYYGEGTRAEADSVLRARGYLSPLAGAPGPGDRTSTTSDPSAAGNARGTSVVKGYLLPIPQPWPILDGLITREVDSRTGLLASRWCPQDQAYLELYLPGTEPTEYCDISGPRIFRRSPDPR